ncbi:MAG: DUF3945 domain-containing protein [Prevotellaceae bacterium]|jgi:hypothetical protein|nr:DUF3945 domain-containing protein [Prevotellaceae bacterium]
MGNDIKKESKPKKEKQESKTVAEALFGVTIDERDGLINNAYRNFMEKYHREPKIPIDKFKEMWADFEKLGLTMLKLQQAEAMPQLIDGKTTEKVLPITTEIAGAKINTEGKIALHKNKDGEVSLKLYPIKNEPNLKEYFGHVFTDEERENILKTGSPGTVVYAEFNKGEGKVPVLLTLDKDTNHFVAQRKEYIKIPDTFFHVALSEEQKQQLSEGKIIKIGGMMSEKNHKIFSTNVVYNAQKRGLELLFEQNQKKKLFPPKRISNIELTEQQQDTLQEGKAIFAKDLVDKQGRKYDAHITWNSKTGKLSFSSKDPNDDTVKKVATPEYKIQVAANNDGHKPEALKNVQGAIEKKQPNTPTTKQVAKQKQEKAVTAPKKKGMKM